MIFCNLKEVFLVTNFVTVIQLTVFLVCDLEKDIQFKTCL